MPITIKSEREIELMTEAGRILGIVHKELEKALKTGMSTLDIDALGEEVIRSYGCETSFLNYNGYPASICVSVNDEIVHGIPSAKHLIKEGDIVSLDAGVIYKGYHSDAARTHAVGEVRPDLQKLIDQANDMKADKDSYCDGQDKAWADLDTELGEAVDALKDKVIYSGTVKECTSHLTAAMKAVTKKIYETITTPASTSKDGSIVVKCSNCGDVKSTTTIAKIKSIALNKTSFTENGKVQKATVVAKDSANKTIAASNYTVSYSNSNSKKPGTYTATVKFNGKNYAGTKKLTYKINAKAPAKTTVKLSKAKKTSLKASWSKVANATSYEVQYGTSKSFKGAKTVKVSSKSSSKVLTKLKKNKKYYVRVRAVRTVKVDNKNTTLRASWSSAKNLKTKKK